MKKRTYFRFGEKLCTYTKSEIPIVELISGNDSFGIAYKLHPWRFLVQNLVSFVVIWWSSWHFCSSRGPVRAAQAPAHTGLELADWHTGVGISGHRCEWI